ncbi:outer membrane beta-barrel protein [Niabella aquatica]
MNKTKATYRLSETLFKKKSVCNVGSFFIACLLCFSYNCFSQKTDSLNTGSIKGRAKDSTYNFMLTSATVAVYKDEDSSLLQFSLPDNFGEFAIHSLPLDVQLRLIITHVGYSAFLQKFSLSKEKKEMDFGLLYMHQNTDEKGNVMEEVVVKAIPPMRMNGDTLEFNADAFRLDSNATAEDLMRRLPGFTIWGDGEITFNGKKINQVLVEGKPFMGSSNVAIATQNLPKDALDKIQVYQQRDEKNPLDSTMFANIKLKADKKMGYFGKLSGAYGTDDRYAVDGMISGFNKKLQLSTVGAFNNINKMAGSTDVLMSNTTFKGEGTNLEYQSDFNMRGLNRQLAAGAKLQYDFIPDVQYQKSSRLAADYFFNHNNSYINDNTLANTFLSADTILSRRALTQNRDYSDDQRFSSNYTRSTERMNLVTNAAFNVQSGSSDNESTSEQEKTGMGIIGKSSSRENNESRSRNITGGFSYTNRQQWGNKARIPREFTMGYQFSANGKEGSGHTRTQFESATNTADNRIFDRLYAQRNGSGSSHQLNAGYPNLTKLIFDRHSFGGIQMGITATYILRTNATNTSVQDLDTVLNRYVLNGYLTNSTNARTSNFTPAFVLSKSFYKGLTNRYNKWVNMNAELKKQWYGMQHDASRDVQDFSYQYHRFIPNGSIEYNNHQYGSYEVNYKLEFSTQVNYPNENQVAPLVDSSNLWYIPKGNRNIQPEYQRLLAFGYRFTSRKSRNPYSFWLKTRLGQTDAAITDSAVYNNDGVRTVYLVNHDGRRYVNGDIGFRKSQELGKSTLELNTGYRFSEDRYPQYIDGILNISNSRNQQVNLDVSFRHQDLVTLKAEQGVGFYNSRQQGFNDSRFKSNNQYTRFIGTLQLPKNLVWSTNITYNKSTSNGTDPLHFTIWNASLTYRFLKGNQGEAKFSALDLLRQNKGIINTSTGNTQTFTTSNVLQQYFMLTLSYYLRKFGK